MSYILLLRLTAPMQSWGVMSRFSRRDTGKEPSKSGVVGLLCAALGISRDAANATENPLFAELIKLKMGVLVLREGVLQSDYHTAQNIIKADGRLPPKGDTKLSTRFYLADADFVVALEGENGETLETIQNALKNPKWQLFLGRKSFAPAAPIRFDDLITTEKSLENFLGSRELKEILDRYDAKFGVERFDFQSRNRLIVEADAGGETRPDVPLSFAARRFTNRRVKTAFIEFKNGGEKDDGNLSDENDA